MLNVMKMHQDATSDIDPACPDYLQQAAEQVWDECLESGQKHGYRNAQATGDPTLQTNPMCRERFPVSRGVMAVEIGLRKVIVVTLSEIGREILPVDAI